MAKLLLKAENIQKSYGDRQLLHPENLEIWDGDRIGLIGENGAGKTTLLKILSGEEEAEAGTVHRYGSAAMIHQQGNEDGGGDERIRALFRAGDSREELSGGEMTRNRISAALSGKAQLLFADEPTTDLDEEGLRLLREQLAGYAGALVLVSHDRALLRKICRKIWYLEDGKVTVFPGGWDAYMAERQRQRERQQFEWEQYRGEQKRLQESARILAERAEHVKKAPSRMGNGEARLHKREWTDAVLRISHAKRTLQNRMEQMEVREKPRAMPEIRMKLGISRPVEAKTVLGVRCEMLKAGGTVLLQDTGFQLPTGSRTALIGRNGCGKTTLLRVLSGQEGEGVEFRGTVRMNPQARPAWFDQHHEKTLKPERTVLENIMELSVHPESEARKVLSRLNFRREDAFRTVSVLSGGERAKVALARILLTDCNLLVLDEPTNHLDLFTMAELERLLAEYGGTVLFVSHDEEFIRKTATRMIRFDGQRLVSLEGSPEETERQAREKNSAEEERKRLAISSLEMRLAALAARMSAPKKGDRPESLREEYDRTVQELAELKRAVEKGGQGITH